MSKIKRLHFKDLNGLRFIAFVPVFLFICSALLINKKSVITVQVYELLKYISINSFDFFFFLSSFLVTSLALREYKYRKSFSLKMFYVRRIFRLIPLLFISFIFAFYFHDKIISFLKLTKIEPNSMRYYLMGIPNFKASILNERFAYTITIWVVFMFLQFYLVWGLILKYLKSKIIYVGFVFMALGLFIRLYYSYTGTPFYYNPLSYGVSIGIGGILAHLVRNKASFSERFKQLKKLQIRIIYIVGVLMTIILYPVLSKNYLQAFVPFINGLFFCFVIMEQTFSKHSVIKLRKIKLLNRLGKITYGLLIYSSIVGTVLVIAFESVDKGIESPMYKLMFIVSTFIFSWVLADISYNSIEKLFMRIRRDFKKV